MRSLKALIVLAVGVVGTFGIAGVAAGQALEDSSVYAPPGPPPDFNVPMWDGPDAILFDNGTLVTHPGGGAGGADASAVQTALGNSTYGFGHAISSGFRVADDFTVPAGGWNVTTVTFFAYQTGSGTTSTINNVNLRIWNGPPNAGGSVIWGDTTTNVLTASSWSNIYRVLDTGLTDTARPIMADVVTVNTNLAAGTYWLDWQTGGTLTSGPWAPPVTILGQTGKPGANALQYSPSTGSWAAAIDTGNSSAQDFPFIIEGTGATGPSISLAKTVGTVPGVCATTSAITVDAGTSVSYCYEVTNTGDVTFTTHDLVDDQLGTLFTGLPYTLAPGAGAFIVIDGVVVNNTVTNTATWTAYVPGGPSAQATDSATVTAIPPRCPAGYEEITLLTEAFEGGFPPAGWAVVNNGGACVWTNTDPGGRGNLTGSTGLFAIADSDACGSGTTMNTDLWSAPMDFTGLVDPIVTYYTDYNNLTTSESADLDFSTDGGATWTTLLHWNTDHRGPLQVEQAFAADNQPNVLLRWHYIAPSWDWWWEVDDVVVTACLPVQVGDPDIEVTPTNLFASQMTNTITQQVLNIGNTGDVDLDWQIFEEGMELGITAVQLPAGSAQAPESSAVATGAYTARPEGSYAIQRRGPVRVPPDVLLLAADDDNPGPSPIQTLLQAYGDLGVVNLYDPRAATPTLAELQAYDVVVVWSNYSFFDATAIGNVLADYVDAGGKVIDLMFALDPSWGYQGRFRTDGYSAMTLAGTSYTTFCLGTFDPVHPIMAGITDVCDLYRGYGTALTAGSSEVARWQDNELFVAVKDNGTVASINGYVGYYYQWTGQMPDVLHNAILWVAGAQQFCTDPTDVSWLSEAPTSGITAPGGSTPVDVYFDSTGIPVGIYEANLCVVSNDPDEPLVEVPVTMEVVIPVELMGISVE